MPDSCLNYANNAGLAKPHQNVVGLDDSLNLLIFIVLFERRQVAALAFASRSPIYGGIVARMWNKSISGPLFV